MPKLRDLGSRDLSTSFYYQAIILHTLIPAFYSFNSICHRYNVFLSFLHQLKYYFSIIITIALWKKSRICFDEPLQAEMLKP